MALYTAINSLYTDQIPQPIIYDKLHAFNIEIIPCELLEFSIYSGRCDCDSPASKVVNLAIKNVTHNL